MKEDLIRGVLKRVGVRPLERLAWVVDFAQRPILTPGDRLNAEVELTCFMWAAHLTQENLPGQVSAMLQDDIPSMVYRDAEITLAQQRFTDVLKAAAGRGKIYLPLKHVKAEFTQENGLTYEMNIPERTAKEAKMEVLIFKLLRLLGEPVRTNRTKAKGGERFMPLRLYVGVCLKAEDGCGKLFAKTRTDQQYCSRRCASRAQVRRFRAKSRKRKATR